ncbi:MAG: diacylglycerol kinase, partial [Moorella sp. (in: Bacteria)]|nr:diacylglycerol kinase [Moorella sp. (in: firmicutes)]
MLAKFLAALAGVVYCLRTQINMAIHLAAMATVIAAGRYFQI